MTNMHKQRASLSQNDTGSSQKRQYDSSADSSNFVQSKQPRMADQTRSNASQEEPRFTFEEVKEMIEKLLAKQTRASAAVSAGLKKVNFEEIAVPNHSVQGCKDVIEQLVLNTRRVRTLQEVLLDIKENLRKRTYTEIIHRATLKGELPKRPPSAYLLYHQDRYNQLRSENSLAVEVSKIVAEEWKNLKDKKKREYQRRHEELVDKYEREMAELGLVDDAAPKRPRPAKSLYIEACLTDMDLSLTKEELARKKEEISQYYDSLDPEEKRYWTQLHKDKLQQYQKLREEYIASHPHLDHAQPEKKTKGKEKILPPAPPKRAAKFYIERKLPEGLEGEELEAAKKRLKDKFATLSERKALKYIKKAIQDKERYDREVEEFKAQHPGKEVANVKNNVSKEQWKLYAKKVENRPSLPAPNAYLHYCGKMLTDMYDNDDDWAPTQRMQNASAAWKQTSEWEKQQVEAAHLADIQRYCHEMDVWLMSQTEERKRQLFAEEPKAHPDYWRKRLSKLVRIRVKKESNSHIHHQHQNYQQGYQQPHHQQQHHQQPHHHR